MAIELFEQALKAVEHGIKRWLVAGEIAPHKAFENAGIAIFQMIVLVGAAVPVLKELRG